MKIGDFLNPMPQNDNLFIKGKERFPTIWRQICSNKPLCQEINPQKSANCKKTSTWTGNIGRIARQTVFMTKLIKII